MNRRRVVELKTIWFIWSLHNTSSTHRWVETLDAFFSRSDAGCPQTVQVVDWLDVVSYHHLLQWTINTARQLPPTTVVHGGVLTSIKSGLRCRHHDFANSTAGLMMSTRWKMCVRCTRGLVRVVENGGCLLFVQIVLTVLIASPTAERSFSTMKRVKTYLRSTMTDQRLNNLSVSCWTRNEPRSSVWSVFGDR